MTPEDFKRKKLRESGASNLSANERQWLDAALSAAIEFGKQQMYEDVYSRDVQTELKKKGAEEERRAILDALTPDPEQILQTYPQTIEEAINLIESRNI